MAWYKMWLTVKFDILCFDGPSRAGYTQNIQFTFSAQKPLKHLTKFA